MSERLDHETVMERLTQCLCFQQGRMELWKLRFGSNRKRQKVTAMIFLYLYLSCFCRTSDERVACDTISAVLSAPPTRS